MIEMQKSGAVHVGFCVEPPCSDSLRRYQNLGVVGVAPRQQPARERRQHLLGGAVQVERRERVGARRAVVEERKGQPLYTWTELPTTSIASAHAKFKPRHVFGARCCSRSRSLSISRSTAARINCARGAGRQGLRAYRGSHHASVQHFTCRSFF